MSDIVEDLEKEEYKAFVMRCRRAKVPVTKLKKYEKEVDEQTFEIRQKIKLLEYNLKYCFVGKRRRPCCGIYVQKDFDEWRKQIAQCRKMIDVIITRIKERYFP